LDLSTGEEERKDNYYLLIGKAKYFGDASPATLISSSSVEEIMTYTKKVSTKNLCCFWSAFYELACEWGRG